MPGPGAIFVPSSGDFPQVGENRTVGSILDDLTDYVGGGNRAQSQDRARRALQSAVRMFNTVAWRFCRQRQTITLSNNTSDYTLNATFRTPLIAHLLDTNGKATGLLDWVRYEEWATWEVDEVSTATSPEAYTTRNVFSTGQLTFIPRLGIINTQYPQVRLDWHSRIVIPTGDSSILSVPVEVEEAIVQEAVAFIVAKVRSFTEAQMARAVARDLFEAVKREWRDFPQNEAMNRA